MTTAITSSKHRSDDSSLGFKYNMVGEEQEHGRTRKDVTVDGLVWSRIAG